MYFYNSSKLERRIQDLVPERGGHILPGDGALPVSVLLRAFLPARGRVPADRHHGQSESTFQQAARASASLVRQGFSHIFRGS